MAFSFRPVACGKAACRLCTQLADKVHGPLSALELRYTRRVTAAWTLFFVLNVAATFAAVRVRAAAHLVAVREFLRAAADSAHVRGGICGPAPRAAASAAQRVARHPARLFCESALKRPMDTIALLSHTSPTAIVAYRGGSR